MAATVRVLRRTHPVRRSIKKITKAQELVATSRIAKAQARVEAARPYAERDHQRAHRAGEPPVDHPLLVAAGEPAAGRRLVITSDRGLCGGYNANVLRAAEQLDRAAARRGQGAACCTSSAARAWATTGSAAGDRASWTGFSERPTYDDARRSRRR